MSPPTGVTGTHSNSNRPIAGTKRIFGGDALRQCRAACRFASDASPAHAKRQATSNGSFVTPASTAASRARAHRSVAEVPEASAA